MSDSALGNLLTHTDEENKTNTYTYDKKNRQLTATFAGETTTRLYHAMDNFVSVTRPEGNAGSRPMTNSTASSS